jgi:hypothetical protein
VQTHGRHAVHHLWGGPGNVFTRGAFDDGALAVAVSRK